MVPESLSKTVPRFDSEPSTLNVLIVEDDSDCAESMATLLRLLGHEVQTAANGLTAVKAGVAKQFDVVLLDIGLPGLTGFDLANWIRARNPRNPPYLVAISGHSAEHSRHRAAAAGIDLFLQKPVDPWALKDILNGV